MIGIWWSLRKRRRIFSIPPQRTERQGNGLARLELVSKEASGVSLKRKRLRECHRKVSMSQMSQSSRQSGKLDVHDLAPLGKSDVVTGVQESTKASTDVDS